MKTTVQKITMRFPFFAGGQIVAASIPGPSDIGTYVTLAGPGTPFAFQGPASAERVQQNLIMPRTRNSLPLVAIGIAPDSPIHSADLAVGNQQTEFFRSRISPGNPLIGLDGDWETIGVTLPNCPPLLNASGFNSYFFDAAPANNAGVTYWGFPLRLEAWYGDYVPVRTHKRAVQRGRAEVTFQSPGNRTFGMLVDGRKNISVEVIAGAAGTLTYTISQEFGDLSTGASVDSDGAGPFRVITGPTAVAASAAARFEVLPNNSASSPYQLLVVTLTDSVGSGVTFHQVSVCAWDD